MKKIIILGIIAATLLLATAFTLEPILGSSHNDIKTKSPIRFFSIGYSHNLNGLEPLQWWPIVDSSTFVGKIAFADITVTDTTTTCAAPPTGTAPTNVQVLVGEIGGRLVNVATDATNTGVASWSGEQCIFKVTVIPEHDGVPATVTDIIAANAGGATLDGTANITVLLQFDPVLYTPCPPNQIC